MMRTQLSVYTSRKRTTVEETLQSRDSEHKRNKKLELEPRGKALNSIEAIWIWQGAQIMVFGASGHFSKIFTVGSLRKLENLRLFQSLIIKCGREEKTT